MSETIIYQWLPVTVLVICLMCILRMNLLSITSGVPKGTIRYYGTIDLRRIGRYNEKLTISVKYWIYAIIIALYKNNNEFNSLHMIREWNEKYNYDPQGFIYEGIERAQSELLSDLEMAREFNKEPRFMINPKYDFHNVPMSFERNEFINQDALLEEVDRILAGGNT